jgi:hypothetical protein
MLQKILKPFMIVIKADEKQAAIKRPLMILTSDG